MQRLFRLSFLMVILGIIGFSAVHAQLPQVYVSGSIPPGEVRIFLKDSLYLIDRDYVVGGTLIIEPGTTIRFLAQGRLIDSTGGRIIADGRAAANYTQFPNGIDPLAVGSGFYGYADPRYFMYKAGNAATILENNRNEPTVNTAKYDHIFNVQYDTLQRRIVDLNPELIGIPANPYRFKVPFEHAVIFAASRLGEYPTNAILNNRAWARVGNRSVNVAADKIRFIGQDINPNTREFGHIIVLPGARAAFFRDCVFENFVKDTTVDRKKFYFDNNGNDVVWNNINKELVKVTNGTGAALTTFSARTWLLNCEFVNNRARNRGGALAILQAPDGYPIPNKAIGYYDLDKNPNITDRDGSTSSIIQTYRVPKIDMIDETAAEPLTNTERQAFDDARIGVYLGRMRNLKFENNKVQLANHESFWVGTPPRLVTMDNLNAPATFPYSTGNEAKGGAVYIAGKGEQTGFDSQIEIGLGVNNTIKIGSNYVSFSSHDSFEAIGNSANNYQSAPSSKGARGGAIYVGQNTSLIVGGEFSYNETYAKFLQGDNAGTNSSFYSMGGAIFTENTFGRLQVRGGPKRDLISNQTHFTQNKAAAGGAIYVDGAADVQMSPIIGGSDALLETRDYGFNVKFIENEALAYGGAIFTHRNMSVNGSGGTTTSGNNDVTLGYGGNYPVAFEGNSAGFAGGAIHIEIPNPALEAKDRSVHFVRAAFRGNDVGLLPAEQFRPDIRGGGAIYSLNADINLIRGSEFIGNMVVNGNGGALAIINPKSTSRRYFLSDIDIVHFAPDGVVPVGFHSNNDAFTFKNTSYPPDQRMQTRFLGNAIELDSDILESQSGTGTTQMGYGLIPTREHVHSTYWTSNSNGTAVGANGLIIKLANGGSDWTYQNSTVRTDLNDVWFTGPNTGYAVGARNVILKTVDGGNTWYRTNVPMSETLNINVVTFIGTNDGYAVCDEGWLLKTNDAGENWSLSRIQNNDLNGISFVNSTTGYAVGASGSMWKTTNAGATWNAVQITGLIVDLNMVRFFNANVGYAVGDAGIIVKTTDAGNTWDVLNTNTGVDLWSLYFTSQSTGYIVGQFGAFYKTTDGGATWDARDAQTTSDVYDVFFPTPSFGYVVGKFGLILKSIDGGENWNKVEPANKAIADVVRYHPGLNPGLALPENGVGLGGAIYILDSISVNRVNREDSIRFNRVRIQNNEAYTGAAIYSDNYDLKLIFTRSLITGNVATSEVDQNDADESQNVITGPVSRDQSGAIVANKASSDLAGAILYGEVQGPLPAGIFSEAANSIYNNDARFLIRLPDAPNTKGVLAGSTGIGFGGTDTLRGNYWGQTEANVWLQLPAGQSNQGAIMETFFVAGDGDQHLHFIYPGDNTMADPRNQGPFESIERYTYRPVPLVNGADEYTVGAGSIPEMLVFSGYIYDIYDKGTDIKTADYTKRRMSPIEDFAVGVPPVLRRFADQTQPSYGKYVKRWIRNPFDAEDADYQFISEVQGEFRPDENGNMYHPIGYPLYLEALANYEGLAELSNYDPLLNNESVFFVINETTGDFIRVNMKQFSEAAPAREKFRTRVELVPDQTVRNPIARRISEGLLNFGSAYSLLNSLRYEPYKEDGATLTGRRYHDQTNLFGLVPNLFSNRPSMPVSNQNNVTYWAGERYSSLPVNVGDVVRIVSRTVLWKEGEIEAYDDGIAFTIVESTKPPVFTGNIVKISKDTVTYTHIDGVHKVPELLNKVLITEDRRYPATIPGQYSGDQMGIAKGRDSILTVTAIDLNKFYDPRGILYKDKYTQLQYTWRVDPNSALKQWLQVDTMKANAAPKDGAFGYLVFKGKPINPYVVPGGEEVVVTASNFPPHYRAMDILKQLPSNLQISLDSIDKFVETFPPYFANGEYDEANARFLQQDTINFGPNFRSEYRFKIMVLDSAPRFIPTTASVETVRWVNHQGVDEVYVEYRPSVYTGGFTNDGRVIASVTDKLRMQLDFNTDDEMEDISANLPGRSWDFRYGRTAYGFQHIAVRNGADGADTTVIDSSFYDNNYDGVKDVVLYKVRPVWMGNQYLMKYGTDTDADPFGIDFTTFGQLNVRIPRATVDNLLKPTVQFNRAMNTDTLFTVLVNDGHSGINKLSLKVFVNFAPTITTTALPNAKEDYEYNPHNLDSTRMIKVFDPNFNQKQTFALIYNDYPDNQIPKDPNYPEAGFWDLSGLKTTPKWLRINPESGILYGKPGVKDAPKNERVTVVVWDENGLTDLKTFDLRVDSTNHRPNLYVAPKVICVDRGVRFEQTVRVHDIDLLRETGDPRDVEELKFRVILPTTGFVVEPATIKGTLAKSDTSVKVIASSFNPSPEADGKVTIKVEVDDGRLRDTLIFRVNISDATDFVSNLTISNSDGAFQVLQWGTAPTTSNPTTGDGLDGEVVGTLDLNLCEFELPPIPTRDVYDARWTISQTQGTLRSIFPRARAGQPEVRRWKGRVQPGGETGGISARYPITYSWDLNSVPAINDATRNPAGSVWYLRAAVSDNIFSVDMNTGSALHNSDIVITRTGSIINVAVHDHAIREFVIVHDWINTVDQPVAGFETKISEVSPNPLTSSTSVKFGVMSQGKVRIDIVDALGNTVKVLSHTDYAPGSYTLQWNGTDESGRELPSGAYTVRMVAGSVTSAYPVVIVK